MRQQGEWRIQISYFLCDGSGRSRSRNGGSLGAGLGSSSGSSSNWGGSRSRSWSCGGSGINGVDSRLSAGLGVGRAVAGNVAGLGALVADLAGGAERAAVGSSAVTRDVAELAAGVALHGLGLAVTGEVVGTTALVAGGCAGVAAEAAAEALEATTGTGGTAGIGGCGVGAVALETRVSTESGWYECQCQRTAR